MTLRVTVRNMAILVMSLQAKRSHALVIASEAWQSLKGIMKDSFLIDYPITSLLAMTIQLVSLPCSIQPLAVTLIIQLY
jgi:hypothetical protein